MKFTPNYISTDNIFLIKTYPNFSRLIKERDKSYWNMSNYITNEVIYAYNRKTNQYSFKSIYQDELNPNKFYFKGNSGKRRKRYYMDEMIPF